MCIDSHLIASPVSTSDWDRLTTQYAGDARGVWWEWWIWACGRLFRLSARRILGASGAGLSILVVRESLFGGGFAFMVSIVEDLR